MQENIAIVNQKITGTLKYVTGYTQFSGVEEEQSGNYLAVKITDGNAASIKVSKDGENYKSLDSDGIVITRLTDVSTQKLYIESTTAESTKINYTYDLSGLTLNES